MASAVFQFSNESHWVDEKVCMRKTLGPVNPISDCNRNSFCTKAVICSADGLDGKVENEARAVSDDFSSIDPSPISLSDRKGNVTVDLASYSRKELNVLKHRLVLELEQVRNLLNRIESTELQHISSFKASTNHDGGSLRAFPVVCRSDKVRDKGNPAEYKQAKAVFRKQTVPSLIAKRSSRDVASGANGVNVLSGVMKRCWQLLMKLMRHKDCWIFLAPVDVVKEGLHDYFQIIKLPMDLGTVKSKLEKNAYMSPMEFASDVRLTFRNALMYNPKGHHVHTWAEKLLCWFEDMFGRTYKRYQAQHKTPSVEEVRLCSWPFPNSPREDEKNTKLCTDTARAPIQNADVELQAQDMVVPSKSSAVKSGSAKQEKPKAKNLNKREMSFEEKQKLSMNIQSLPDEKINQVLQIIRKRNLYLAQEGDEIEVDIEAVDTDTLWELDRIVCNFKMMSKMKKRNMPGMEESETAAENIQPGVEVPEPMKKRKQEAGEEDVDIGEEIPSLNFPPVEIEKDCSSSSSTSDSSSSDSSSRSSSGTDSGTDDAQSPSVGSRSP